MFWRGAPGVFLALAFAPACSMCGREDPPRAEAPSAPVEPVAAAPAPPPATREAVVVSRAGKVEVRRGSRAAWGPVNVGDRLGVDDAVRTFEDGELKISVTDVKVHIHSRSEFRIKALAETAVRAQAKGHVEGEVPDGKGRIEIEGDGSDALVKTEGGRFSMTSDGRGVVAVASTAGRVNLSAAGRSVDIRPGQVSHVRPGASPGKPSAALRRVLLSVEWGAKETNRRELPVAGRVEPGTRVLVQGKPVEPDASGNFKLSVPLRSGRQVVAVVAEDVLGRRKKLGETILMDETLPDVRVEEGSWR